MTVGSGRVTRQTTLPAVQNRKTPEHTRPYHRASLFVTINYALPLATHIEQGLHIKWVEPLATRADHPFNCLQHRGHAMVEPLATYRVWVVWVFSSSPPPTSHPLAIAHLSRSLSRLEAAIPQPLQWSSLPFCSPRPPASAAGLPLVGLECCPLVGGRQDVHGFVPEL